MTNFILFIMLILCFISIIAIPYWTRKTESFGVTVPESLYLSNPFKNLRKKYAWITGIISLLVSIVFLLLSWKTSEHLIGLIFSINITLYLFVSFVIYLIFHFKVKRIKQESNWPKPESQTLTISTNFRNEKLTYSNKWFLFSIIPAVGMFIFTIQNYHLLPAEIPLQFNFSGEVTSTVKTSYRSSLILPIMQIFLTRMFAFINTMTKNAKQQIETKNTEQSIKRNVMFRRRWSLYLIISGNVIALLFFFIQLSLFYPIDPQTISFFALVISILMVIGAIYLSFTTGQGGSRIKNQHGTKRTDAIDRDDDIFWKLGVFYFNREDPALFLEKRFGVGWTINLARPLVWIIVIAIITLSFLIPYVLK